jgi:DNA-directed RNA polymerase specialized sigma54-like protein
MVNNNNFIMIIKNFFIHGQQQLHPSPIKNFFIHDHQQQLHDHQQTFSSMVNNNFIHHPSKTFSFMVNNNFMIINNNFIHHPSTTSSIKNFFIHDHQQQLHSPLPSTYILTTRLHHMVNTFIIGQLVRTIIIRTRRSSNTSRRVVNYPKFILHR